MKSAEDKQPELAKEPDKFCKVGGIGAPRENYDLPHVTGLVQFEEFEVIARNCVFCGRDCSEFLVGGLYE